MFIGFTCEVLLWQTKDIISQNTSNKYNRNWLIGNVYCTDNDKKTMTNSITISHGNSSNTTIHKST